MPRYDPTSRGGIPGRNHRDKLLSQKRALLPKEFPRFSKPNALRIIGTQPKP